MGYSEKVVDHYENPRNVGKLDKDDPSVGTGLVGAPACGDVMRLQIKVTEDGIIEDAKFKTFGCLAGNNLIATPAGYTQIRDLKVGDEVWAWDGVNIVTNEVKTNSLRTVDVGDLIVLDFGLRKKIICTRDHIWWSADNRPMLADSLKPGMELLCATKNEFKSLNNVGKQVWLKKNNSKRMVEFNKNFDHSSLPQNNKGFVHSEEFCEKISKASKRMWKSPDYVKNWQAGMADANKVRPTKIEKEFIDLFDENQVDARYVGNGQFWVNCVGGSKHNPDFKINGQKKLIEVYTKKLPHFMQNRESPGWMVAKKKKYAEKDFDCMFIEYRELDTCIEDVQRFIHNGIVLKNKKPITHGNELRGISREGNKVIVHDLELKDKAKIFFVQRVMSHNCGSAIASSSLATEWIKGRSIDDAEGLKNTEIVEELNLPPIKVHCSILAEDAIKSAIADFRAKQAAKKELECSTTQETPEPE